MDALIHNAQILLALFFSTGAVVTIALVASAVLSRISIDVTDITED